MSYPNTSVLQLPVPDTAAEQPMSYQGRLANDQALSGALVNLDDNAARVSGSFYSLFSMSGAVIDVMGSDGGAGVLGVEYTRTPRIIQEVVAWAAASGSGVLVTRLDVQVQQGPAPANFSSIYSNNAFKPAISSSLGNYGVSRTATFVSGAGAMPWPANTLLKVSVDAAHAGAGLNAQRHITCQVFWKPSGSYGA